MNMRAVCLALVFTIVSLPAYAQGRRPVNPLDVIRSLVQRIDALTERVSKLESGQVDAADLVGTYALHIFGIQVLANPARVAPETFAGTVALNADGTYSIAGTDGECTLQQAVSWAVTCSGRSGSMTSTWRVEDGMLVIVDEDGEHPSAIGAGGRMMIFGGTADFLPTGGFSNIGIAVRLPNP